MPDKQQTFGKVKVSSLSGKTQNRPYCSKELKAHGASDQNIKQCSNRAILVIENSLEPKNIYRCGIHAKSFHLSQIESK